MSRGILCFMLCHAPPFYVITSFTEMTLHINDLHPNNNGGIVTKVDKSFYSINIKLFLVGSPHEPKLFRNISEQSDQTEKPKCSWLTLKVPIAL